MSYFGTFCSYDLFTYCDNTPVDKTDPRGYKSTKLYSGLVGFGVQILLCANVLGFQAFIGIEALWFTFTKNNNFENGLIPWCYWFAGGSFGVSIDIEQFVSTNFFNNPEGFMESLGLSFSLSIGITFFFITAKNMKDPKDYLRDFTFNSITIRGVTLSKASGSNISTYGFGFTWKVGASIKKGVSIGKYLFGGTKGFSYYWALPIGPEAKALYSMVENNV